MKYHISFLFRRIKEAEIDLKQSDYYIESLQRIQSVLNQASGSINEIICFGIGHFSDCSIARYQFAFISAIKNDFNVKKATFHEPILFKSEVNILKNLNCDVFEQNLEGKLSVTSDSSAFNLIYSPHCPKQLSNNFLWKNWNKEQLSKIIFLGNSFTNLLNSTPSRLLEIDASFIVKIHPFTSEIELRNNFKYTDIFNDTALHTFPSENLKALPESFWNEYITEPVYSNNVELITSELFGKLSVK